MTDFFRWRRQAYAAARLVKKGIPNPRYDTSDIAQESVLQLLKGLEDAESGDVAFDESYLRKVGEGKAREMHRRHRARKRAMEAGEPLEDRPGETKPPWHSAQEQETVVLLLRAISELDEDSQRILYRRFFDQRTLAEIAAELETSIDIVRRRCQKALDQLQRMLRE